MDGSKEAEGGARKAFKINDQVHPKRRFQQILFSKSKWLLQWKEVGVKDLVVGIDPGKRGAWVVMDMEGKVLLTGLLKDVYNMTDMLRDKFGCDPENLRETGDIHIFLEKGQSFAGNGGKSMFTYGLLCGGLEMALHILKYKYTLVQPRAWCKVMHVGARGDKAKEKSLHAGRALFPNVSLIPDGCRVIHDGIVDALLIAEYGRRSLLGRTQKEVVAKKKGIEKNGH